MTIPRVEYVGFRSGETGRDYSFRVRHADGRRDECTLTIEQDAFLSRRVRYQDAAEICFLKLARAVETWAAAPEAGALPGRQDVTDGDLLAYRERHAATPRVTFAAAASAPAALATLADGTRRTT